MGSNRITYLAAPPRGVPLAVACSAMMGIVGGIGLAFLLFGLLFSVIFVGDVRPMDEWRLARSTATAHALVTTVSATHASENDVTVYAYRFSFTTSDEQEVESRCYTTGQRWSERGEVVVRYIPEKPQVACPPQARLSQFTPWVLLFVLIFPLIGALMIVVANLNGWRQLRLLREGLVADGRILSRILTNTRVNHQPVMKYTYEFRAQDGQTCTGDCNSLLAAYVGDEACEPVLYLPDNPRRSVLLDALPLRYPLEVDSAGEWVARESIWPVLLLGLSWLTLGGSLLLGLARLLGLI